MEYKAIPSPIKWAGGKQRFRERIISLLPPHSCYVEPFAGAAWVLFGKPLSDVEIINDIDGELVNFFRIAKNQPEDLILSFDLELISREEFGRLANTDITTLSDIQRAHRFFYLIMAGWGGESNYPRFQTSVVDGGHGNRLIGALKNLRKRIDPVHDRLRTVIIENLDWKECIDKYDRDQVVMYIDPPYPGNGVNYKHNMKDWNDHQKLADKLNDSCCKWILSSYNTSRVTDMYKDCHVIPVESYSGMSDSKDGESRVLNKEVLILNYDPEITGPARWKKRGAPKNQTSIVSEPASLFKVD
ncbi:MAG TPA: DNA adenine methylase [Rhodothermales bacterium]|nr:DNA adenine methylase [Rhodothermales bacterium]